MLQHVISVRIDSCSYNLPPDLSPISEIDIIHQMTPDTNIK